MRTVTMRDRSSTLVCATLFAVPVLLTSQIRRATSVRYQIGICFCLCCRKTSDPEGVRQESHCNSRAGLAVTAELLIDSSC